MNIQHIDSNITQPLVSIIVPCRNEIRFIGDCLDSIIANDYPKSKTEVIVADGMSNDGTREILEDYSNRFPFIRWIENPKKVTPAAFNAGITDSKGQVIIIMGAHTMYNSDYVSKCIKYLYEYDADNVGGVLITLPKNDTLIGRAISHAMSTRFGFGNATFRTGSNTIKEVDTVFGGCYRREVFDKIGLFNEELLRGQDREFNVRLKQFGGKIILAPDIKCYYYARSNLKDYGSFMFLAGRTPFFMSKLTQKKVYSIRNLVPLGFVLSLLLSLMITIFSPTLIWLFLVIFGIYLVASLFVSIPIAITEREFRFILLMPAIYTVTHLCYGLGSIAGILKPVSRQQLFSQ